MQLTEQQQLDQYLDMDEMVEEIKVGQPRHTDVGWLQIFPQAKSVFGKFIRLKLRIRRERLKIEYGMVDQETDRQLKSNPVESRWRDDLIIERGETKKHQLNKQIAATNHQLALLGKIGQKPEEIKARGKKIIITEDMIEKAKAYPLEQLIEINRQGFTRCFGHNDKKPSAYGRKNFLWCFVCNKGWDTIQILVERDGLTFRQAVLQLQ